MAGTIGLLVVHGIGAQQPGDTLAKLTDGLRLLDPDFAPRPDDVSTISGGQRIRLYEAYWADILDAETARGSFQLLELQSLAWFPWFNRRGGNYRGWHYPLPKIAWWTLVLPVLNLFVMFAYYGIGLIVEVIHRRSAPPTRVKRLKALDDVLDTYAGDVFAYLNAAAAAFYRERNEPDVPPAARTAAARILARVREQIVRAAADGCDEIQIVAHSLGTVIAYHALTGFAVEGTPAPDAAFRAALSRVRRLYTIGSPLEKIRFFWPRLLPPHMGGTDRPRWDNFVSVFDPVSGPLVTFADWGPVRNHRLLGGGFFTGHIVYERSPVFLRALGEGLCGRPVDVRRTRWQAGRDALMLGLETLAAPVGLAAVVALGAALYVLVALLVPYLLSWTVRWWMPAERWAPVVDALSLLFLGLMTLTFLIVPRLRAHLVHKRFWVARDHDQPRVEATGSDG